MSESKFDIIEDAEGSYAQYLAVINFVLATINVPFPFFTPACSLVLGVVGKPSRVKEIDKEK